MALIPKIRNKHGYFYIRIKGRDYYLGKDLKAQAFLGHESASTSEIYSEVDTDLARQIAEKLG